MRCAQCGTNMTQDPIWSNGAAFCSLECAEECLMVNEDSHSMETSFEIRSLFGAEDDDD